MRSTNRSRLLLPLLLLAAASACSRQQQSASDAPSATEAGVTPTGGGADGMRNEPASAPATTSTGVDAGSRPTADNVASSAAIYNDVPRKFIRTAQAEFRVNDVYKASLAIEDVVAAQGGFVAKNQITTQTLGSQTRPASNGKLVELTEYTVRGELTVRVPGNSAQTFLRAIVGQMEFLDQRNFEATDAQFALLRQQLDYQRNQEAQQQLGQIVEEEGKIGQKAEAVTARTGSKASRDEALIAQKEFEDKIAFSTINLSMYQSSRIRKAERTDVEAVFQQNSPGFFVRLGKALAVGWYGILDALVALMALWPLWLLALFAALTYRRFRKKT